MRRSIMNGKRSNKYPTTFLAKRFSTEIVFRLHFAGLVSDTTDGMSFIMIPPP